jgi:glycosyltransferase involved in cell wall biosynthesis
MENYNMKPQKLPLSVFIIARNEEERLAKAINSVREFADEIIVVEYGSIDNTVDIAKNAGATVLHNEWNGYGAQKIFGENQCKHKWILNIDADEEISNELAEEIKYLFISESVDDFVGYKMRITNVLWNEKKPKPFAVYINRIRLYNTKKAGFRNSTVHDCVIIDSIKEGCSEEKKLTKQLAGRILHRSILSLEQLVAKINQYSTMTAMDSVENGRKTSNIKIIFAYPLVFIQQYIIKRYFIYGIDGFVLSIIHAFGKVLKYAKIKELQDKRA